MDPKFGHSPQRAINLTTFIAENELHEPEEVRFTVIAAFTATPYVVPVEGRPSSSKLHLLSLA
jgi:hypothetical protein